MIAVRYMSPRCSGLRGWAQSSGASVGRDGGGTEPQRRSIGRETVGSGRPQRCHSRAEPTPAGNTDPNRAHDLAVVSARGRRTLRGARPTAGVFAKTKKKDAKRKRKGP